MAMTELLTYWTSKRKARIHISKLDFWMAVTVYAEKKNCVFSFLQRKGTTLNQLLRGLYTTNTSMHAHHVWSSAHTKLIRVRARQTHWQNTPSSFTPKEKAKEKKWSHKFSITFDAKIKLKAIPKGNRSTNVEKLRLLLYLYCTKQSRSSNSRLLLSIQICVYAVHGMAYIT